MYWSMVTGSFFGATAPVITTTPRMFAAATGRVTPRQARAAQTANTNGLSGNMPRLYMAGRAENIGARYIGVRRARRGSRLAPETRRTLLAGQPVLLDERPEPLGHLSGADRLVTHDGLERFGPAAELDRIASEVLLTGHPSPASEICASARGPTLSPDPAVNQNLCARRSDSGPGHRQRSQRPKWNTPPLR